MLNSPQDFTFCVAPKAFGFLGTRAGVEAKNRVLLVQRAAVVVDFGIRREIGCLLFISQVNFKKVYRVRLNYYHEYLSERSIIVVKEEEKGILGKKKSSHP